MISKNKRSQRLAPILKLALHEEQEAARKLELALLHVHKQEQHLDELFSYQKEYLQRHAGFVLKEQAVGGLRAYKGFLDNLASGIVRQKEIIVQAQKIYDAQRVIWLEKRSRSRSLAKVTEQHKQREETEMERSVQRAQDERSGRHRPAAKKNRN